MTTRKFRDPAVLVNAPDPQIRDVVESLNDVFGFIRPFITVVSNDYTTSGRAGHEIVKVDSAATITLHSDPQDGDRVTIKRTGSGAVTVSGTIDGAASVTLGPNVGLQLIYIDGTDWTAI